MDGDGRADRFTMERSGDKVLVSVMLATGISSQLRFATPDFSCSALIRDPACGDAPQALEPFRLGSKDIPDLVFKYDLEDPDVFVSNGRGVAVEVQPGDTDAFIFFWNVKSGKLDWLRL
jgi:hypothetical protein